MLEPVSPLGDRMKSLLFLLLLCSLPQRVLPSVACADRVIEGRVLDSEEDWDRRSNPLMGRPDFLRGVKLRVQATETLEGRFILNAAPVQVLAKGDRLLKARL